MPMTDTSRNLGDKNKRQRSLVFVAWGAFALSVVIYVASAYRSHSHGETWLSAFGLSDPLLYVRIFADFGVPVVALVFMMQTVNRLPPSPERTRLRWIGWAFFIFLFVWWGFLRMTFFGTY